jgi:transcriptional regulator with XRE-family HTH domain
LAIDSPDVFSRFPPNNPTQTRSFSHQVCSSGMAAPKGFAMDTTRQTMPKFMERSFGDLIRRRRRQLNLTQEEVARRIKSSVPYIGLLEAGKRHPSEKVVIKLADAVDLDRVELFFLANPGAEAIVSQPPVAEGTSAWETFSSDSNLRKVYKVTDQEIEILSKVALMGNVRSSRDFIFVLNTIRHALGR